METLFRELSADEISFIAGGDPGDIVVTGGGGGGGGWGWGGGGGWGWGGGGGYGTSGGGGGGGDGPPPVNPPPPETPCERDAMEDSLAQALSDMIKSHSDWNAREYAASIIRYADGNYGITALTPGETMAEAQARATAAGQTSWAPETHFPVGEIPAGAMVVGVIHNHPDVGYTNAEDITNRYPSYNPGYDGDYNTFDTLVGHDSRFASADQFTQYILGPDGVLREFGYSEGHVNAATDANAASRSDLTADRPCH